MKREADGLLSCPPSPLQSGSLPLKLALLLALIAALTIFGGALGSLVSKAEPGNLSFAPTLAYGAEITVDIQDMADPTIIKAELEKALDTNDLITVTHSGERVYDAQGAALSVVIPDGKKVIWKANYSGNYASLDDMSASGLAMMLFSGGIIEFADCSITNTGTGTAIYQGNGTLTIAENTTISSNGLALIGRGEIAVKGGSITSLAGEGAVWCTSGTFTMTGGTIYAAEGYAIQGGRTAAATVTIMGGFVFAHFTETVTGESAHGTETDKLASAIVMFQGEPTVGNSGVVAIWNTTSGATNYIAGTGDDLTVNPANKVVWWNENGQSGIRYNADTFFALENVSVTNSLDNTPASEQGSIDAAGNTRLMIGVVGSIVIVLAAIVLFLRMSRGQKARAVASAGADAGDGAGSAGTDTDVDAVANAVADADADEALADAGAASEAADDVVEQDEAGAPHALHK